MRSTRLRHGAALVRFLIVVSLTTPALAAGGSHAPELDSSPPSAPVKLIFIHHSTGENWLADGNGGLGIALRDNNYFVSDTNYGWGPDGVGSTTDIGHWWSWFSGPSRDTYAAALYAESGQNASYSRLPVDPGGPNEIVLFKSCFPNSALGGLPGDPPTTGSNPLRGQDAGSQHHTVGNAKGIYNDILAYFQAHQEKLFVVIAAPPLAEDATDTQQAANARAFNDWLRHDWLASYPYENVFVFDLYNVLTSNGGDANTNDLGRATGNHHRVWGGAVQYLRTVDSNLLAYPTGDSHPSQAGNRKATGEFATLLNVAYHAWHPAFGPAALALDAHSVAGNTGNENGVLEPGEAVSVEPAWHNGTTAAVTTAASASGFAGPAGAVYSIADSSANYGTAAPGATNDCFSATGDCYLLSVSDPASRPAAHWDTTFSETLAAGGGQTWTLHVGGSFSDVPNTSPYYRFVETLFHRGVTGGCSTTAYCPASLASREQMAVFVLAAKQGPGLAPAACTTPLFADVPASSPFCSWVEELARRGVVGGCSAGLYCPGDPVTREQMAVFALKTLDPTLTPPACSPPNLFTDVPETSPFCSFIEELANRGVVSGCGGGNYCPGSSVTREQMAVFIGVSFGLTLYGP